ncbi:MAG: pyridoxamine kinase [Oscillospiraceae bacterium]|nr:pyridoxamine kinase [Oscillospiraceae bacterium]
MKRILTIQDISCVGKCSLTAALPILSAMGTETVILPTAVLSSHSAFSDYTFCDLTAQLRPITEQWKAEGITFDAIYTGYLGSVKQVSIVEEIIAQFRTPETCVFVDPVLGDFGHLYHGFSRDFPKHMQRLCQGADVIVPNMTEAACLLGIPYLEEGYDAAVIEDMLRRLSKLGARSVVLTGVSLSPDEVGFMGYDADADHVFSHFHKRFEGPFHGTGDVFASTCVGALLRGAALEEATALAADFTLESIRLTALAPDRRWYGIHYESAFPFLMERLHDKSLPLV